MKKDNIIISTVILAKAQGFLHLFFDNPANWFVYGITGGGSLATLILMMCLFSCIDKPNIKCRSVIFLIMVWDLLNIIETSYLTYCCDGFGSSYYIYTWMIVIPIWIYRQLMQEPFKPDKVNDENYFYALRPPKSVLGVIVSLFYVPAESLSIYAAGYRYGMKRIDPKHLYPYSRIPHFLLRFVSGKAGKQVVCHDDIRDLILIDTGVKITKDTNNILAKTVNEKWSLLGNCFPVYQKALGIPISRSGKIKWEVVRSILARK